MLNKLKNQVLWMMVSCLCLLSSLAVVFSDVFHIHPQKPTIVAVVLSIGVTATFYFLNRFQR